MPSSPLDVVIIGAGAASLSAARALLASNNDVDAMTCTPTSATTLFLIGTVTIVEANSYVGGRIKSDDEFLSGGNRIDLGAEIVHGFDTMLTDVIDAKRREWQAVIGPNAELLEEIYIASHADGGPAQNPTKDGKYGVYYLSKEDRLLRFDTDDADFCRMSEALSALVSLELCDSNSVSSSKSLADHLGETSSIPQRMVGLLSAGYGNTAGCTDLSSVSLDYTVAFEKYWEENEEEGDARLHPRIGMMGVIDALRGELESDERCSIHLNWTAGRIEWAHHEHEDGKVVVISSDGRKIVADQVIITASPPVITTGKITFDPPLPQWKVDAYNMVGMDRAVKVILRFQRRLWPKKVQTVICDFLDIPECWFRDIALSREEGARESKDAVAHLAVCFLTSKAADSLIAKIDSMIKAAKYNNMPPERRRAEAAADIVKDQLATVFSSSCTRADLEQAYVSALMYDWSEVETIMGGYMYPRVGILPNHFLDMARNIDERLYFAGEATNTGACCTVQAAMETGLRVANDILGIK